MSVSKYNIFPGETYGNMKTIERIQIVTPAGIQEWRWKCEDENGNFHYLRNRALYAKLIGVEEKEEKQKNIDEYLEDLEKNHQNQMGLRKKLYQEYISNAIKRLIPFNLTFDNFNDLISGSCYYCGSAPEIRERLISRANMKEPMLKCNGIDRLDSFKFYDMENCVPCCSACNMMKNTLTMEQFLNHINKISEYQKSKESSTTIPEGSTSQANGDGSEKPLE